MTKPHAHPDSATRQHLLKAALKCFAERGYAAASVQEIVDAAKVSKPALYYYFADKADLFQAVVNAAHDERLRLMQAASERGRTVHQKLEEILGDIFEYSLRNRELMRLTFATAFATSNEAPGRTECREKGRRNFEFVRDLIEEGQRNGELTKRFSSEELAMGIYGQLNSYVMIQLLAPDCPLNRATASQIVKLFLEGAAAIPAAGNGHVSAARARLKSPLRKLSRTRDL